MFAGDIRRQRVSAMRGFRRWRWHLDEMYAKLNGEMVQSAHLLQGLRARIQGAEHFSRVRRPRTKASTELRPARAITA